MLVLALPALSAPPTMPKATFVPPRWQLDAGQLCYGSGLLLDVVRRPEAGVVAITMVVDGGDAAETDETRGAAHLVEHLWFRSHPAGGPAPWDVEAGLELMGTTGVDATVYTTVGDPRDVEGLLALEAQRLLDPLQGIDEAAVAAEKRVVANELEWRGEHSVREAHRYLDDLLWPPDHAYAAKTGTVAMSDALTLAALRTYAAATHRPENTVLRIEGAVDLDALPDAVRKVFPPALLDGERGSCVHARSTADPPDPRVTDLVTVEAPVNRPRLYVAWSLPAGFGPEDALMRLAVDAVNSELWRPLWREAGWWLRGELELGCTYVPGLVASEAVCSVDLPEKVTLEQARASIRQGVDQAWTAKGGERWDTWRLRESAARLYLDAFAALDRLDHDSLAARALSSRVGLLDPAEPLVDTLLALDDEKVGAVLDRWFTKERMVTVGLVPGPAAPEPPLGLASAARLEGATVPSWHVPEARSDVLVRTLGNGLGVWAVDRSDAPVLARTALVSQGGWATSPEAGLNEVLEALERYDLPVDLAELRREVAITNAVRYGPMADEVATTGASGNLDLAAWMQRGLATGMVMDFSERQSNLDPQVEGAFTAFRTEPTWTSRSLRTTALLPGDRAGQPWWEGIRAARYVSQGRVLAWQRSVRHPEGSVLVVVSDVGRTDAAGRITGQLGGWKGKGKRIAPALPPPPPAPPRKTWLLAAGAALTDVITTCRVPGRTDDNAAAHAVLLGVLDRAIHQTLRAGGSYANEAWTEFVDPRVGLLTVRVRVPPDDAPAALAAVHDLLEAVARGAPDELVAWGRLDAAGDHARALASAEATFETLRTVAAEGRTPEGLAALAGRIAEVRAEDLGTLLAGCAGHEATTVIGPEVTLPGAERLDWAAHGAALAESLR